MMIIFKDFLKHCIEVFVDDFSMYGSAFNHCLSNLMGVWRDVKKLTLF